MTTIKTMQLEIVSAEAAIFSGKVKRINATGIAGELGIYPGHRQLLTFLKLGQISILLEVGGEDIFYISGGMLEVQPEIVTVLADTVLRVADLDESVALVAKERSERQLAKQKSGVEYSKAMRELAEAIIQLRIIQSIRKRERH
ncbi:MAG: F0F1 ATP synthase subunit epsilon [Coxiella-like endosymbiont]|uniref:F0F1 ATP synthase subunit epsilon n=1 Tax=Coxiella-like endosymbiont TaxID=1592897 RepID=UPI00215A1FD7|nr:F0F1 ATP synthase subunit epsilon [Coxiella-like endosymbiont]UVE59401.1 F0F1 ATP synthase subunit epsilon [Coxiella-like endosymbiont]